MSASGPALYPRWWLLLALTGCRPAVLEIGPPASMVYTQGDGVWVDTYPQAPDLGDLDGDGRPELFVPLSPAAALLELAVGNDGGLTELSRTELERWPQMIATADFDDNGHVDVAVVMESSFHSHVMLGTEHGTLELATVLHHTDPDDNGVLVADVDADGDQDVIVSTAYNDAAVEVWENDGSGGFSSARQTIAVEDGCRAPHIGDIDRDGWADILCGTTYETGLSVLHGTGSSTHWSATQIPIELYVTGVAYGDFEGSGSTQVAVAGATTLPYDNEELWMLSRDGATFAFDVALDFPASRLVAADLDGDGDDDLVASSYDGPVAVLESLGDGHWAQPIELIEHVGTIADPLVMDIDGEPPLDIVLTDNFGGRVVTFLGEPL